MTSAIEIDHLYKRYRLGNVGHRMFFSDIKRWCSNCFSRKTGLIDDNETYEHVENGFVNALWDVNLTIKQGEILGIIGSNGAGKSTLLKILSRITSPDKGEVRVRGKIASLLEIGAGFHPELTGRQNIFLNGAINGMSRKTIDQKFDSIIDFAGVEKFIDTPVKRYSSGMYVRLAFAVAAHLDSEIILVDEVLAVGDLSFQKKCLGKIDDVSRKEGCTVLFVSHNLASVKNLCPRSVLFDKGKVIEDGPSSEVIQMYIESVSADSNGVKDLAGQIRARDLSSLIKEIWIENGSGVAINEIQSGSSMKICFRFKSPEKISNPLFGFYVESSGGQPVFSLNNGLTKDTFESATHGAAELHIPELQLMPGNYFLTVYIDQGGSRIIDMAERCVSFRVHEKDSVKNTTSGYFEGLIHVNGKISLVQ
jgi:lipopolysaccharide transport system ATP-binding protein